MATRKKKKNEIAKAKSTTVSTEVYDYGEDAGVGMEITMADLRVPRISLIQGDSRVRFEDEPNYVPGAEEGQLLNSGTKELYNGEEGILIVPAMMKTTLVEFKEDRGGFVAEHEMTSEIGRRFPRGRIKEKGTTDLVKTSTLIAVRLDPETMEVVEYLVIPFTSSKLGAWSSYFTKVQTAKKTKGNPLFSRLVRLISFPDKKGSDRFANYKMFPARNEAGDLTLVESEGCVATSFIAPGSDIFLAARGLRDDFLSGKREAAADGVDGDDRSDSSPY